MNDETKNAFSILAFFIMVFGVFSLMFEHVQDRRNTFAVLGCIIWMLSICVSWVNIYFLVHNFINSKIEKVVDRRSREMIEKHWKNCKKGGK